VNVTLKLFATLADHLPAGAQGNQANLDVGEGATIADVISGLNLPARLVHLVLVNGAYVAPEQRAQCRLAERDQLAIWPPIAGG
jgi:sulfur carrier protein ThiS